MPPRRTEPTTSSDPGELTPLALESIISLERASEISNLSVDTLRRRFPDRIIKLSARRSGMRVKHALMLD
jgi:hypothetical protein